MQENRTFLKKMAIFQDLADSELQSVAEMFKERQYKRNEIIFVEEDTGQYMCVVKKGRVKASRTLPNGREPILSFHQEGEYFGEMALIDGETAPANVTAVVATTILIIDRHDFSALLDIPQDQQHVPGNVVQTLPRCLGPDLGVDFSPCRCSDSCSP
jgi:CRP/FNR family cyclic AMP-dependent transcriptional regulator